MGIEDMLDEEAGPLDPLMWYFMLRVADSFYAQHGRYPGWEDSQVEGDVELVAPHAAAVMAKHGMDADTFTAAHRQELVRFGAAEIQNVAALIGGMVSQEAI